MVDLVVGRIGLEDQNHDVLLSVQTGGYLFYRSIWHHKRPPKRCRIGQRGLSDQGKPGNVAGFDLNRRGQWDVSDAENTVKLGRIGLFRTPRPDASSTSQAPIQGCGSCPQLPNSAEGDISRDFFTTKRDALRDLNLHIVTVSRWMMEQCKKSPVFEHVCSYHRIPYGLAMDEFRPIDRLEARRQLGIDSDAFVFAFGAADIRNHRKGFGPLIQSSAAIADVPKALGLVFGGGEIAKVDYPLPELRTMGFIREVQQMVLIHSACDVFILPSLEDNLPFTCLEALATGTPVVAFDAGGVPDMVRPGLNGWISPNGDSIAMGQQLKHIAEHREEAVKLGLQARAIAVKEYSQEREAADYAKLYINLLANL